MTAVPRIALVGSVAAAAPPAERAFAEHFPAAQTWNILDDRLISDALEAGEVTAELSDRMSALIDYAVGHGADGVLLTCSMYSTVAHAVAPSAGIPVLGSDDAAFADAAAAGFTRIALVASLPVPLADARARLDAFLSERDVDVEIVDVLAPEAVAPAAAADAGALARALYDAVRSIAELDAVLLAQYSISLGADPLAELLGVPVLSGPGRAAVRMRQALRGQTT